VAYARSPLFTDFEAGRCVVRGLYDSSDRAETLCFVVMPDHLHWLLRLRADSDLSITVQKAKALATGCIHRVTGSQDAVWQSGFHDRAIRDGEDVRALARYVVANPLRAGLVSSLRYYSLWDAVWLAEGDESERLLWG
jgi:REP element-mobilizing transposase RayT